MSQVSIWAIRKVMCACGFDRSKQARNGVISMIRNQKWQAKFRRPMVKGGW
jgi:ribosomal protein L37E